MMQGGAIVGYSDLEDMRAWAAAIMQRRPDFVIGDDYLRRWWVVPRNRSCNVYLHEILHSDDDRALHDHPWDNVSYLLDGSYIEVTPEGEFLRGAGSVVQRQATDSHRLVIPDGGRAVSLFLTGPIIRDWGFHCPQGWLHWREFVDGADSGKVGRGCGEHPRDRDATLAETTQLAPAVGSQPGPCEDTASPETAFESHPSSNLEDIDGGTADYGRVASRPGCEPSASARFAVFAESHPSRGTGL